MYESSQAAIATWHRLGGLSNGNLFPPVLVAESVRSRYSQGWFLLRLLSFACRWPPLLPLHMDTPLCAHTPLLSLPVVIRTLVILV